LPTVFRINIAKGKLNYAEITDQDFVDNAFIDTELDRICVRDVNIHRLLCIVRNFWFASIWK